MLQRKLEASGETTWRPFPVSAGYQCLSHFPFCAEPEYAEELIEHAKQMLDFGTEHSGSYMKSKLEGLVDQAKHYPSSNFNDELSWGAIWLYFATGVS